MLFSGLSAITFLLLLVLFWRHNQFAHKRRYSQWERSFLPTLWHFNGAGIGFLQRSCKAVGGYGAKVLPSGGAQEAGWEQPWCRNNPPADQEDTVEWVKVA